MTTHSSFVLLDTDVFSYIWNGRPEGLRFASALQNATPVLSFVSVAEAHFGAAHRHWGARRIRDLEAAIALYLVVPYDPDLARQWGTSMADARRLGHPLGQKDHANDLWICATAILHGMPLATNNRDHFDGMPGLKLVTV